MQFIHLFFTYFVSCINNGKSLSWTWQCRAEKEHGNFTCPIFCQEIYESFSKTTRVLLHAYSHKFCQRNRLAHILYTDKEQKTSSASLLPKITCRKPQARARLAFFVGTRSNIPFLHNVGPSVASSFPLFISHGLRRCRRRWVVQCDSNAARTTNDFQICPNI